MIETFKHIWKEHYVFIIFMVVAFLLTSLIFCGIFFTPYEHIKDDDKDLCCKMVSCERGTCYVNRCSHGEDYYGSLVIERFGINDGYCEE